ncbi:hypothetical protein EKH77_13295 [Streptomyces luteoverticillatus]|uniref:Uncharacterized protein n=1 Tax=Streptomyces luteoverticillatus TaxID=66425 RepID=A0A3Q9FZD1_STRLT|nr:hypothetical protein EKH77_13295 [Streptomyces luteoverticillatus]
MRLRRPRLLAHRLLTHRLRGHRLLPHRRRGHTGRRGHAGALGTRDGPRGARHRARGGRRGRRDRARGAAPRRAGRRRHGRLGDHRRLGVPVAVRTPRGRRAEAALRRRRGVLRLLRLLRLLGVLGPRHAGHPMRGLSSTGRRSATDPQHLYERRSNEHHSSPAPEAGSASSTGSSVGRWPSEERAASCRSFATSP